MTETRTYPLRLPRSVKEAITKIAEAEGVSVNQFIASAVAEKLAVINAAEFFAARQARVDFKAFRRIMRRKGGQPPPVGDER